MCKSHASLPLQSSQWATHLEDAVQFEQTQGLFLLPGGRPVFLGAGGSGTGSAGVANSYGGRQFNKEAAMHAVSVQESLGLAWALKVLEQAP